MSITSTILSVLFSAVVLVHFLCVNCGLTKPLPSPLKKLIRALMTFSFPLLGILMFTLIYAYAKNIGPAPRINSILSDRLRLPLEAYHQYGLKAFGSPLTQVGHGFSNFKSIIFLIFLIFYRIFIIFNHKMIKFTKIKNKIKLKSKI